MVVLLIIFAVLFILCAFKFFSSDSSNSDLWGSLAPFLLFITVACLLASMNFKVGTEQLTGYIYSSNDRLGYTTGHLRFSENAGTDEQPSFCAKSDSEVAGRMREYAGSGKKVRINIPPYFYFSNNPFACGTTAMTIEEIK